MTGLNPGSHFVQETPPPQEWTGNLLSEHCFEVTLPPPLDITTHRDFILVLSSVYVDKSCLEKESQNKPHFFD